MHSIDVAFRQSGVVVGVLVAAVSPPETDEQPSSIRGLATPWTYFLHLSLSSVILIDSSTGSPVHVLMLSIQAVRGLPCLRAPSIVPCIITFSRHSLVSWWCDHSMLASLLWQCLTVPSLLQLCQEPTHLFSLLSTTPEESFSVLSSQRHQDVFLHSFWKSSFYSRMLLSLVVSSFKSICCDFSMFSAVIPRSPALCLTWYGISSYAHHLL